ncbi:basic salivary proline-rich protein 2-like [Lathamus discolor]|uniref:basic salivary proline-rich protein 2-like n=1 Tax=Lathamus discolor TaxID=678569 RepID=UPI0032B7575A
MLSIPPEEPAQDTAARAEGRPGSAAAFRRSPGSAHSALGRGQPHIFPPPRTPPPAGPGLPPAAGLAPAAPPRSSVPRGGRRAPAGRGPLLHVGCSWPRLPPAPAGQRSPHDRRQGAGSRRAASLPRPPSQDGTDGRPPAARPANGAWGPQLPRALPPPRAAPGRGSGSPCGAPQPPPPPPPGLPRGCPVTPHGGGCRAAAGSSVPCRGPARPLRAAEGGEGRGRAQARAATIFLTGGYRRAPPPANGARRRGGSAHTHNHTTTQPPPPRSLFLCLPSLPPSSRAEGLGRGPVPAAPRAHPYPRSGGAGCELLSREAATLPRRGRGGAGSDGTVRRSRRLRPGGSRRVRPCPRGRPLYPEHGSLPAGPQQPQGRVCSGGAGEPPPLAGLTFAMRKQHAV